MLYEMCVCVLEVLHLSKLSKMVNTTEVKSNAKQTDNNQKRNRNQKTPNRKQKNSNSKIYYFQNDGSWPHKTYLFAVNTLTSNGHKTNKNVPSQCTQTKLYSDPKNLWLWFGMMKKRKKPYKHKHTIALILKENSHTNRTVKDIKLDQSLKASQKRITVWEIKKRSEQEINCSV